MKHQTHHFPKTNPQLQEMGHNSQPMTPHALPDSIHSRQPPTHSQQEYDHDAQRNFHSTADGEHYLSQTHRISFSTFGESCRSRLCSSLSRRHNLRPQQQSLSAPSPTCKYYPSHQYLPHFLIHRHRLTFESHNWK